MPHHRLFSHLEWECDQYGTDVVAAFGEYCGHRQRFLSRLAWLGRMVAPRCLSAMIQLCMGRWS